ncbi:TIGR03960 family B12-binding radical SAM protein [bacterium]|nr:TIGR03960 family B12-binding radical SAM protein [bacterium]
MSETLDWISKSLCSVLPTVSKPGRYAGNEFNAARKDWTRSQVRFVLAFPEVYEIGMSHSGLGILYHILNRNPWILADRVYAPWTDMESAMRGKGIPLFGIESKRPVRDFDAVGFTLQYELHYTNILNMLDLSGIPQRSMGRSDSDPLILAGGPCAFNPEPMSAFFDAVVLGDGEEVILEIAGSIREGKLKGWNRAARLQALSRIPGVYIPSLQAGTQAQERIRARILDRLDPKNYPEKPIVPFIEISHDRYSLEIMRGCVRGCRFCNAGIIYRPARIRQSGELIRHAEKVIQNTGFDEIALSALSSSDYPDLLRLLHGMQPVLNRYGVSLSFPSLRSESFTPEMADFAATLRRSGLTLAPEAGTQRLRNVINKNNTEDDLLGALKTAFERDWRRVKLYFMIGLPTETQEDLDGIVQLVGKAVALGKKFGRKEIHVSLSPFSPKPMTPFQWDAQDSQETLERKTAYLKSKITWRAVDLSWRDPRVSRLETILGRGDRSLGDVILNAWSGGARFDAWSELFSSDKWTDAFQKAGVDPDPFTRRIPFDAPLPWDHLDKGVSKAFLKEERIRAEQASFTPDCLTGHCSRCGLTDIGVCTPESRPRRARLRLPAAADPDSPGTTVQAESGPARIPNRKETGQAGGFLRGERAGSKGYFQEDRVSPASGGGEPQSRRVQAPRRIRIAYRKGPEARFTSHLDTMRVFDRTFRRAGVAVSMSQGFHSHARLSGGPPLPLGYTSRAEYLDVELFVVPKDLEARLNFALPDGFGVEASVEIPRQAPALIQAVEWITYVLSWEGEPESGELKTGIERFLKSNSYKIVRKGKSVDIRLSVTEIRLEGDEIFMKVRTGSAGTARPEDVFRALLPAYQDWPSTLRIERTGQFAENQGRIISPMDITTGSVL